MELNKYQHIALRTALYPGSGELMGLVYTTLGLSGESGEMCNKVKKIIRGDKPLTPELKLELAKELGDALWYVATTAKELGFDLETVAQMNVDKLQNRAETGTIKGDGDNR